MAFEPISCLQPSSKRPYHLDHINRMVLPTDVSVVMISVIVLIGQVLATRVLEAIQSLALSN